MSDGIQGGRQGPLARPGGTWPTRLAWRPGPPVSGGWRFRRVSQLCLRRNFVHVLSITLRRSQPEPARPAFYGPCEIGDALRLER